MSSEDGPHPLGGLVLHLLPGRIPGLTQRELLRKIERILYRWPDLSMQEVRPVVLSAVLASLERRGLIEGNGEGAQRCYWRVAPLPLPAPQGGRRGVDLPLQREKNNPLLVSIVILASACFSCSTGSTLLETCVGPAYTDVYSFGSNNMWNDIEGRVYRRGHEGYEQARRAVTWHAGTPNRFPAVIVQARNEHDVIAAVRLARTEGMQVAVRSGGHSWSGSHLRDGVLLLDLSELREVSINAEQMTATVQPGLRGSELDKALRAHHLYFPIGHCTAVGLGGYLLQGGFGWSGRPFGPACMSVTGIDVVTADGERTYADETQHADLFWAARGSGPGFFAVVTRFHIKLYPRHRVTMNSTYIYPIAAFEEVYRWVHEIGCQTPTEINVILTRDESVRTREPVIVLNATAFADSEQEARSALSLYERCPARHRAFAAQVNELTTIAELSRNGLDPHFDPTRRYVADNMWTHAPFDDLLPGLRAIIETLPPAPSHMLLMNWGYTHAPQRPAMAYSVEDNFYYALYVAWNDPADDDKYKHWVTDRMRAMEPFATGIQLADENLINRPARFVTDDNLRRLDQLRAIYDPDALFVSWPGRPPLT